MYYEEQTVKRIQKDRRPSMASVREMEYLGICSVTESLWKVRDDVVDMLCTDGKADGVRLNALI